MFLTILMWIGIGYLGWMISGYLAFRLVNKVQHGGQLMSNHFWNEYVSSPKRYMPLTPSIGIRYMFVWGFIALLIACIVLPIRGIMAWWKKQFEGGIDNSIGANNFFGIK